LNVWHEQWKVEVWHFELTRNEWGKKIPRVLTTIRLIRKRLAKIQIGAHLTYIDRISENLLIILRHLHNAFLYLVNASKKKKKNLLKNTDRLQRSTSWTAYDFKLSSLPTDTFYHLVGAQNFAAILMLIKVSLFEKMEALTGQRRQI